MKKYILITMLVFILVLSGCSNEKGSDEWNVEDLSGIENPGFTISSKTENKDSITFELEDVKIELVNEFLDGLNVNQDFVYDINHNTDDYSYSYAAFNDKRESIHFSYNMEDHTGYFIYAKSGNSVFIPGIRDMGYSVYASYDYASNNDYTEYIASLFYNISLNIQYTDSSEFLVSFILKDFQFDSESTLGTLSVRETAYDDPIENYRKTGTSIHDLNFLIAQKSIGTYPVDTPYGETSTFFDAMGINQSELQFSMTFTAEIITTLGSYTYDYEIDVMPNGSSVTKMNRYMTVENYIYTIENGKPFKQLD